ncbi:MAG: hypothetical protein WCJ33_03965 [Pseudomonadota bacterium]
MVDDKDMLAEGSDSEIKFFPPDYSIKNTIGNDVSITDIMTPEAIEKAQSKIDSKKDEFLKWVAEDIVLLNEHYKKASSDIENCSPEIDNIEIVSLRIKSQAGTFGYDLATMVAKSLCNYCSKNKIGSNEKMIIIRKHINTISVIFSNKISGDGGKIGKELLEGLLSLVEKYS